MLVGRKKYDAMVEKAETLERMLFTEKAKVSDLRIDLMRAESELNAVVAADYVVGPGGATLYTDTEEVYAHPGDRIREGWRGHVLIISASGGVVAKLKFEKHFIMEQHEPVVISDRDPKENDQA